MDQALLTIEEVLLRIIEKIPHAAEAELTHLKDSVRAGFANPTEPGTPPEPETLPESTIAKDSTDGSADNAPTA